VKYLDRAAEIGGVGPDNYGTRKHPEVRKRLAEPANQRVTLHFTPTSVSN
jgi:hypothetical protein